MAPDRVRALTKRLRQMADEQNLRQQVVYGAADIRDAIEREDVLLSAATALEELSAAADALRQSRGALESIANNSCCGPCQEAKKVALKALGRGYDNGGPATL